MRLARGRASEPHADMKMHLTLDVPAAKLQSVFLDYVAAMLGHVSSLSGLPLR